MRCLGWEVVLLERAPRFRRSVQNIDVRGPGHAAVERMGLLDVVKANTTEQAGTFVTAEDEVVARLDRDTRGADGPTEELRPQVKSRPCDWTISRDLAKFPTFTNKSGDRLDP